MPKLILGEQAAAAWADLPMSHVLWDRRRVANANANAGSRDNPVSARGWEVGEVGVSLTLQFNRITLCLRKGQRKG